MSQEKPKDIDGVCARCGAEFMGRVTDAHLESMGMRKIDGKWVCGFCTGLGQGGLFRNEPEKEQP
jgi:hypothetical protein